MRNNEEIVTIIEKKMKEKGLSMSELARRVGMAKSALSRYFNRTREFPLNRVNDFARELDLTPEYILGFDKYNNDINAIYNKLNSENQKEVYSFAEKKLEEQNQTKTVVTLGKTAAGEPIEQGDIIEEEKEVSDVPSDAEVALVVQGDSMEPDYKNGSVVFYKRQPQVENGELAVVHIKDDGITFKKLLYDYDNKKIILRSLNDKYEDKVFEENEITVLGKVIN